MCVLGCETQTAAAPSPPTGRAGETVSGVSPSGGPVPVGAPESAAEVDAAPEEVAEAVAEASPPNWGHAEVDPNNDGILGPRRTSAAATTSSTPWA